MRVLTINCVDTGSTGSIIDTTEKILKGRCDFEICYERGKKLKNSNRYRITPRFEFLFYYMLGRMTGLKYGTGYTSTMRLLGQIRKTNPDIVHVHCPNVNSINLFMLFGYLKKADIPTVVTNHAEFYYTGNCPHAYDCMKFQTGCGHCDYVFDSYRPYRFDRTKYEWKKMYNSFQDFPKLIMVAVSPWQETRMRLSPIVKDLRIRTVLNGVDTNTFRYLPKTVAGNDVKKILHVTASFSTNENDLKGGRYIIQLAQLMPECEFTVVGPNETVTTKQIPPNLKLYGATQNKEDLAKMYSEADVTVIVSRRETFGMVCAESLCCGTPIVGFYAGGPESIAMQEYSKFVEYGNVEHLARAIRSIPKMCPEEKEKLSDQARQKYSCEQMAEGYYAVYKEVLSN